jgi:hypothetical protein
MPPCRCGAVRRPQPVLHAGHGGLGAVADVEHIDDAETQRTLRRQADRREQRARLWDEVDQRAREGAIRLTIRGALATGRSRPISLCASASLAYSAYVLSTVTSVARMGSSTKQACAAPKQEVGEGNGGSPLTGALPRGGADAGAGSAGEPAGAKGEEGYCGRARRGSVALPAGGFYTAPFRDYL